MDYSSMKAQKSDRKNIDIDFSISKRSARKATSAMRKSSVSWISVLVVLIIAFAGGFFANKFMFSNDTYAMTGADTIFIGSDEDVKEYTEQGVTCIAFGKDYSKDCTVKYYYRTNKTEQEVEVSEVDETKAGIYYAVYSTPAKKYESVTLIRSIIVLGEEV